MAFKKQKNRDPKKRAKRRMAKVRGRFAMFVVNKAAHRCRVMNGALDATSEFFLEKEIEADKTRILSQLTRPPVDAKQ